MITGGFVTAAAAFFPVGALADVSNSGTLFAFLVVSLGVMILRRRDPNRRRSFRVPAIAIIGPLAVIGCLYLFWHLPIFTWRVFFGWGAFGLLVYGFYSYPRSAMAVKAN